MRRSDGEPKKEAAEDAPPADSGAAEKTANVTAGTDNGDVEVISLEDAEEKSGKDTDDDNTVAGLPDDEMVIDTADDDDDDVSDLVVSGDDSENT